ncbi:MAG: hypothetical protein WCF59_15545 [Desulfobaccales bacterium]
MSYPTTQEITDQVNVIKDDMPGGFGLGDFESSLNVFFQMVIAMVGRLEALEAKQGGK